MFNFRRHIAVLLALGLACAALPACTDDPQVGGSGGGGAGGDGGAGGVAPEPPGCADDIQWIAGPAIAPARDHHATFGFTLGEQGFVYVNGGWNYGEVFSDGFVANVGDGAETGWSWQAAEALPATRAGHAVGVVGEQVFIAGGQRPGAFIDSVITSTVQADGSLTPWVQTTALPEARFHLAMATSGEQLIVTGGLDRDTFAASDSVFTTQVLNGVPAPWQSSNLPQTVSHHATFVAGSYVYVAGGLRGSPADNPTLLAEVWRAPVLAEGGIGAWEQQPDLPQTRTTQSAFVRGRCVYIAAGFIGGYNYGDEVMAAPFDEEGNLGSWQTLPSRLPAGRSHMHHVALVSDHAYLLGGSLSYQNVTGDSAIGTFIHHQ